MKAKCPWPDCTLDPAKPERRRVLLANGEDGSRAWLITVGPHAAAAALESDMLRHYRTQGRHRR